MGATHSKSSSSDSDSHLDRLKRVSRADKLSAAFKKPRDASEAASKTASKVNVDNVPASSSSAATTTKGSAEERTVIYDSALALLLLLDPETTSPHASLDDRALPGKTLGSGTYAIVKEAIHISTGKYYACKVINKKLMEGREHMVRNEIAVLKRISSGHSNIVTLHDYFETAHNLYLVFDLCTGGELFDRICAKGNYYEADAADLVRTIFKAVKHIHDAGITQAEDADIMIADFGLSRVMEEEKLNLLTEICGTPGYMAPEIFKRTGHGKAVDVWAMGVISYFLLAGYTPFDRDSQQQEMEAIIAGDYKFEPEEYWQNVSETAKDFVRTCLTVDPLKRPTAGEALKHKWLADDQPHFVEQDGRPADLLPNVKRAFNAKAAWRKAAFGIRAMNRMASLAAASDEVSIMRANVNKYKEESEKEDIENVSITYQPTTTTSADELNAKLANTSLKSP
ncbi:hypothetical protein MD484_g5851, partial [Candolleomyces efflorescens]